MKKKMVCTMLSAVMAVATIGAPVSASAADKEKTIGVVVWDMAQSFEASLAEIAEKEIEERGWKCVLMDPSGDWAKMYTDINDLVTQGVDGIIYTAIDTEGANDAVDLAHEAGIPIIDFDCLASKGGADASVRYDDYAGGQMAAEQCMEALDGKEDAQVIVFEEEPSIASSGRRVDGFTDWMKENYPNAEIIKNRSTDRTTDGCYAWATDMITAYPDADAFFLYWNECTMGTYHALQDAGKTDVYVIGYDATDEQKQVMIDGGEDCKLYASPGMSPVKMGVKCVEFMEQIFDGSYTRSGADDIYEMTPELLTIQNAKTFDINAMDDGTTEETEEAEKDTAEETDTTEDGQE